MSNDYKTFEELKEELGNNYDLFMYEINLCLLQKIDKAIEYIKECTYLGDGIYSNYCDNMSANELLKILGCKEQPKVIVNEDMGIKLDELKNQFNDVWEYGDR